MNINEIIEKQKGELEDIFDNISVYRLEEYDRLVAFQTFYDWHIASIKQILEAEVERLNSKILDVLDTKDQGGLYSDLSFPEVCTYNTCLHHQIGHLTNIINNLK